MYSVVLRFIASLMRSALSKVVASRCWRCNRIVRKPRRPKITTMAVSSRAVNFAPSPRLKRFAGTSRLRVRSVSGMAQNSGPDANGSRHFELGLRFGVENRQILHSEPEQRESHRDNHQSDAELR